MDSSQLCQGTLRKQGLAVACWVAAITLSLCSVAFAQTEPLVPRVTAVQPPSPGSGDTATPANAAQDSASINATNPIPQAPTQASETATLRENVNLRIEQLKSDTELRPELREQLTKLYQQIQVDVATADQASQQRASWQSRVDSAPTAIEEARSKSKSVKEAPANLNQQDLDFVSFDEGQQKLRDLEAQLASATSERSKLSEAITYREQRRKELPQLISDARTRLEQLTTRSTADTSTEEAALVEARNWANVAAKLTLEEQIAALESEQRAIEAELQLMPLKLELSQITEKQLQERVRRINDELNRIRQNRILTQRSDVYELMKHATTDLQKTGEQLLERIDQWRSLTERQAALTQELENSQAELSLWKDQLARMQTRVNPQAGTSDASGFNSWVGLMLRKQRGELPDPNQLQARIRSYREEMQSTDSLVFDIEDSLASFRSQLAMQSAEELEVESPSSTAWDPSQQIDEEKAKRLLLSHGEEILEGMQLDAGAYLNDLYQIADIKHQTRDLSQRYRKLIDEHVLWIRSCERIGRSDFPATAEAFHWLVSYENWHGIGRGLFVDLQLQPWWYIVFLGGLAVVMVRQSKWRRLIGEYGSQAERKNCTSFRFTAQAVFFTILISSPVPSLLLFVAWRLRAANDEFVSMDAIVQFSSALADGLLLGAAIFAPLELLRQVCRQDGLGIKHFEWDKSAARSVATNLRWMLDLGVPLCVIIGIMGTQSVTRWETSLGRFAFILMMPLVTVFVARVFHPSYGAFNQYLRSHSDGWVERLSYVWYTALLLFPLALAVASAIGYHYTALRISSHFHTTVHAAVILLLVFFIAQRWLVINRRKIMLAKARQRLEDAAKRDTNATGVPPVIDTSDIDLTAVNEQTRRLLSSGVVAAGLIAIYLIWSDILPAIGFLDNIKLWKAEGATPDEGVQITLANLVLVIPLVALFFISARNIPGLLEIGFLQHLPLTTAARYATTTITRYVIIGVGIAMASSTLGLRWTSIQWLVAALGVGLGFGLQEIFANFVSGVILLFEQPIRVGDIITVDGTTGTVQKIRMRATTIVNWDRQELIVPNKDLITGKLLNWTLTDSTNRVVINVGVAYGSDPQKACDLIREISIAHPNIMRDPSPVVSFEGFGDNALTIVLRCFLETLDKRPQTIHELHQQIYSQFRAAEIDIAFPQRDLHIRTLPPALQNWLEHTAKNKPATTNVHRG